MENKDVVGTLEKAANEIIELTGQVKELEIKLVDIEKDILAKKIASQMLNKQLIDEDSFEEKVADLKGKSDNELNTISDIVENIDEKLGIGEISKKASINLSPEEQFVVDLNK